MVQQIVRSAEEKSIPVFFASTRRVIGNIINPPQPPTVHQGDTLAANAPDEKKQQRKKSKRGRSNRGRSAAVAISVVAVLDYQGAEKAFKRMIELKNQAVEEWLMFQNDTLYSDALHVSAARDSISEEPEDSGEEKEDTNGSGDEEEEHDGDTEKLQLKKQANQEPRGKLNASAPVFVPGVGFVQH